MYNWEKTWDRTRFVTTLPTQKTHALALLKAGDLVRLRDFSTVGVGSETVSRLVREGRVVRLARGLYQLANTPTEPTHNLAEAAILVPKGVICLTSALQYHELTVRMPAAVWMAIENSAWRPKIDHSLVWFVRHTGPFPSEDVERHRIAGVDVPITTPVRTVVDCFRHRSKVGLHVSMEGLREGIRGRRFTMDDLWRCARKTRAWSVMRPYVEAMVLDGA